MNDSNNELLQDYRKLFQEYQNKAGRSIKTRGSYGLSMVLRLLVWAAGMITLGIFCCLVGYMLIKGLPHLSWDLFSPVYTSENVSLFPALVNTVSMTLFSLLLAVPVALVMKQPDLGTSMMIAAVAGSIILVAKVRWRSLLVLAAGFVASAVFAWAYLLKPYQKKRVLAFLDPEGDVLGAGYHASQSLIAVGSGQASGKGWGHGTQTQLSFLPEQHTDFVFSVWGEEHGFVGAVVLIGLYLVLLVMMLAVAASAREKFGSFLAVGVAAMVFWHVFVNIGMVSGILPVVGVPLPFFSYGGTALVTLFLGVGILMSIHKHRMLVQK